MSGITRYSSYRISLLFTYYGAWGDFGSQEWFKSAIIRPLMPRRNWSIGFETDRPRRPTFWSSGDLQCFNMTMRRRGSPLVWGQTPLNQTQRISVDASILRIWFYPAGTPLWTRRGVSSSMGESMGFRLRDPSAPSFLASASPRRVFRALRRPFLLARYRSSSMHSGDKFRSPLDNPSFPSFVELVSKINGCAVHYEKGTRYMRKSREVRIT